MLQAVLLVDGPGAGRPLLGCLIAELVRHGIDDLVVLVSGVPAETVRAARGARVRVVAVPNRCGTAGALAHAADLLAERFFLVDGSSLFDFNYLDLALGEGGGDWLVRLAVREAPDVVARRGRVTLDGERVIRYDGAPGPESDAAARPVDGGVYWVRRAALAGFGAAHRCLTRNILPDLAAAGRLEGRCYDRPLIGLDDPDARGVLAEPACRRRGAVFFDRDGVLNLDHGYVGSVARFDWAPGAIAAVKSVNDAGLFAFVVTNQSGVARGYYTESDVKSLHAWVARELIGHGAHIDDFRYCPHHPEAGQRRYRRACGWRKPAPGMLTDLLATWPVDPTRSVVIGDQASDLAAAAAAGLKGVWVGTGVDAAVAGALATLV